MTDRPKGIDPKLAPAEIRERAKTRPMCHISLRAAANFCGVKTGTIRKWVHDGRITRYPDGYDPADLYAWLQERDPAALMLRAGVPGVHRPGVSRSTSA